MIPFEGPGSPLATVLNCYLADGDETIVGWCLLLDRECALAKLASVYFDLFTRTLLRVLLANLKDSAAASLNGDGTVEGELYDFVSALTGLIVVREIGQDHLTREFCAYRQQVSMDQLNSMINEQSINELDLLSGVDASSLPFYDDLDGITIKALDELLDQLRAEELESPGGMSTINDEMVALAKGVRKHSRRRRLSLSGTSFSSFSSPPLPSLTTVAAATAEGLSRSTKNGRLPRIVPITVEILTGPETLIFGPLSNLTNGLDLSASIATKESYIQELYRQADAQVDEYAHHCKEFDLLSLIYKILSQPDEIIIRKMNTLEDHEERLRKLGTKLKSSLSPEDLLRTLASLQTTSEIDATNKKDPGDAQF